MSNYDRKKEEIKKELDLLFDKQEKIDITIDEDKYLMFLQERNSKISKAKTILNDFIENNVNISIPILTKIKVTLNRAHRFGLIINSPKISEIKKAIDLLNIVISQIKTHKIKNTTTLKSRLKPIYDILKGLRFKRKEVKDAIELIKTMNNIKKVDVKVGKDVVSTANVPIIFSLGEKFSDDIKQRIEYQLGMKFSINYCYIPSALFLILNTAKRFPKTVKPTVDDFNAQQSTKICQLINEKTHSSLLPINRFSSYLKGRYIVLVIEEKHARLVSELEKRIKNFEIKINMIVEEESN